MPFDIPDKIRKLMATADSLRDGGNELAAAAYAEKVRALLAEYDLDEAAVQQDAAATDYVSQTIGPEAYGLEDVADRVSWTEILGTAVALGYFCKLVVWHDTNQIAFFGLRHNVEISTHIFLVLARTALKTVDERGEISNLLTYQSPGAYRRSFLEGFALRMYNRFEVIAAKDCVALQLSGERVQAALESHTSGSHAYCMASARPESILGRLDGESAASAVSIQDVIEGESKHGIAG